MSLVIFPRNSTVDVNGTPRAAAKAYLYEPHTTNLITVYTTNDFSTPAVNPMVASSPSGIFAARYINPAVNPTYKIVITDSLGNEIYSDDDLPSVGLSQAEIGGLLYPRTAAEITAGETPSAYYWPESTPERYGALGDGVANDSAAIAAAILVNKSGGQSVQFRMRPYKCNSSLSVDPYANDIDLGGATLDFSSLAAGYAIALVSSTASSSANVNAMISRSVRNGYILGGNASGVGAINTGQTDTTKAAYFFGFDSLGVYNFKSGVTIGSQSFETTFRHMVFQAAPGSSGYMVNIAGGGTNYGERVTFFDCGFQNCDGIADIEYGNTDVFFINCSFDYASNQIFKLRSGATVYCDNCHFESNTDSNYWFDVDGANSLLQISQSQLIQTGSRTSYPIGMSGSSVSCGGIELLDCKYAIGGGTTYNQDYLIAGTGRAVVRNLKQYGTPGDYLVSAFSNNSIYNYTFAVATLAEYNLGGAVPPARDTTTGNSDSNSLKFNPGGAQDSSTFVLRMCQPGEIPTFGFYWKATGMSAGQQVDVSILYYDQDKLLARDTSIATGGSAALTTNPGAFTRFRLQAQAPAPPGTRIVLFLINLAAGNARTLWVDDVFASYS